MQGENPILRSESVRYSFAYLERKMSKTDFEESGWYKHRTLEHVAAATK